MPFNNLGLHSSLVQATREMRYAKPTPIQEKAIPYILQGRDIIATAQTGTGKTAAFLLPVLHKLLDMSRGTTHALVISPTRELAQQIDDVCVGLAYHTDLRVGLLVGGAPMGPQEKAIRSGVELIVATPGRLLDHMRQSQVRFDELHTLVLDEADRMLDMGFLPDIKRIVSRMPARQQTLLFSATMPPVIVKLAKEILKKPLMIQIGKRSAPAVGITQAAYPVQEHLKRALLQHLLRSMEMPSVLVFTRTKQSARKLAKVIGEDGFSVTELHGNLTQPQRDKAMDSFRRGDYQVLVATNIAARGLDVDHITHVISFDVPTSPDDYVHRIGRTARAKGKGDAFILVSPQEEKLLTRIERQIGKRLPRITLPDFDYSLPSENRSGQTGQRSRNKRSSSSSRSSRSSSRTPSKARSNASSQGKPKSTGPRSSSNSSQSRSSSNKSKTNKKNTPSYPPRSSKNS